VFWIALSVRPNHSRVDLARNGCTPAAVCRHLGIHAVTLSEIDRNLLERCLERKPRAWEDFVDRFLGLVVHIANHTANARSVRLTPADRDDLCAEVFLNLVKDDFSVLRHFRGQASLATYLTVVARRIIVAQMLKRKPMGSLSGTASRKAAERRAGAEPAAEEAVLNRDEVERLLEQLDPQEVNLITMYHLDGKTYQEISGATGIPENSIGPALSRARAKMRQARLGHATG
jgi:RNA polymerase sigma-70 factor, ECF subfamily